MKNKVIKLIAIILLSNCAAKAQDYIVPIHGQVIATISDKGVNRIAIENDRIAQVIGNEDEYIIESDANLGQIFLTPLLKTPQDISIRFATERDKIIDVKFTVKNIDPQTINFKYKNEANASNSSSNIPVSYLNSSATGAAINSIGTNNEAQQIIENLKLAYSGKLPAIKLPTLGCLKQNRRLKGLKLIDATQYNVNKQIIVKAIVSNHNKDELLLNELDFSNCMQLVQAISIDKNQLTPKTNATIYLVGKDGK